MLHALRIMTAGILCNGTASQTVNHNIVKRFEYKARKQLRVRLYPVAAAAAAKTFSIFKSVVIGFAK